MQKNPLINILQLLTSLKNVTTLCCYVGNLKTYGVGGNNGKINISVQRTQH
jgi:hypothetical protein